MATRGFVLDVQAGLAIWQRYNGSNMAELAQQFNLPVWQVRRAIRAFERASNMPAAVAV